MKAILVNEHDHTLEIGEAEKPKMGPDEMLVRVKATALNRADLLQKRGYYPPPPGASDILGLEMSGVIEEIGEKVTGWKKGDRVCALLPGGGYAQYAVIPANMAIAIPESFSFVDAAAIPEVFLTAYLNLFELGKLKKGEYVLIHAGASGVGTAAIQMAREAGAQIIATAGSSKKRDLCRFLGAQTVIDYKDGPFLPKVMEATNHKGVDLILDFIGAPYWEQNIDSLATDGRLVLIGIMGGSTVKEVDLLKILMKRVQVIGTALRSQSKERKASLTKSFCDFAIDKFKERKLKPIIDSVWDWEEANEAHDYMERNKNAGKVVLRVGESFK